MIADAPVDYFKQIAIGNDQTTVWKILTDINNWSTLQTELSEASAEIGLKPEVSFDWRVNGTKIYSTLYTVQQTEALGFLSPSFRDEQLS